MTIRVIGGQMVSGDGLVCLLLSPVSICECAPARSRVRSHNEEVDDTTQY